MLKRLVGYWVYPDKPQRGILITGITKANYIRRGGEN